MMYFSLRKEDRVALETTRPEGIVTFISFLLNG